MKKPLSLLFKRDRRIAKLLYMCKYNIRRASRLVAEMHIILSKPV
jgi:hypothetical protein